MARKEPAGSPPSHGFNDIIGIVLIAAALLLAVSLLSYEPYDVLAKTASPNEHPHNWIGPFGAWLGMGIFFIFGATAYLLPPLLLAYGLAQFFPPLTPMRRRWPWALLLQICFMGIFDILHERFRLLETLTRKLNAPGPGGLIGMLLNQKYAFGLFGWTGAFIIYVALYFISLLFLTNFQLGEWLRATFTRKQVVDPSLSQDEKDLERRARELEKQARKLQEQLDKSGQTLPIPRMEKPEKPGLGADMQPVPEPTVRDLSVPSARSPRSKKEVPLSEPKGGPVPLVEGEVISATEIEAATAEEILGKPKKLEKISKAAPVGEKEATPAGPEATVEKAADEPKSPEAVPEDAEIVPAPVPPRPKLAPRKPKPIAVALPPTIGNYQFPSVDMLHHADQNQKPTESREELMANARLMQATLAQFDITVQLGDITKGPTITRYELHPAPGVKLEKISALSNNIAAALKAERINILAPVPGKSSVGVEVPNLIKTKVIMRDLLESEEWRNSKARIPLALGKDVYGHPIICDLAEMPHVLIAGSTGSGKSVCINAIVASLLYKFSPDQLRFVMIDPKVVELQQYNSLPHLVVPVVNDPKKVILALRWVVNEMEKRYQIFAKVGVRNIKSFNERPKNKPLPKSEPELPLRAKKEKVEASSEGFAVELDEEIVVPRDEEIVIPEKLSYVVVIIDELADLMLVAPADVEMAIARITQMARAAGIHCIVATQRPSVDVITGVIKANIPARIAFQVAAKVDSRTILDAMGADKLLGKGDMLYLPPGSAKLTRVQGVLITDQEIQDIVDHISKQGKPSYDVEIHKQLSKPVSSFESGGENGLDEDEGLIEQCIEVIRSEQKASVSLMQRRLRLGYTRAARIMDELENRGIVGPSKGAEPRDILIDLDGGGADGAGQ